MELNREQVKQALECCTHIPRPDCNNCPMGEKRGCINGLLEFALKHYKKLDAAAESYKSHCKTLENDKTLRERLANNARRTFLEEMEAEKSIAKLINIYKELIK